MGFVRELALSGRSPTTRERFSTMRCTGQVVETRSLAKREGALAGSSTRPGLVSVEDTKTGL